RFGLQQTDADWLSQLVVGPGACSERGTTEVGRVVGRRSRRGLLHRFLTKARCRIARIHGGPRRAVRARREHAETREQVHADLTRQKVHGDHTIPIRNGWQENFVATPTATAARLVRAPIDRRPRFWTRHLMLSKAQYA